MSCVLLVEYALDIISDVALLNSSCHISFVNFYWFHIICIWQLSAIFRIMRLLLLREPTFCLVQTLSQWVNWQLSFTTKQHYVQLSYVMIFICSRIIGQLHIWDFSGQTTQFFMNGRISLPNDIPGQLNREVNQFYMFFCTFLNLLLLSPASGGQKF